MISSSIFSNMPKPFLSISLKPTAFQLRIAKSSELLLPFIFLSIIAMNSSSALTAPPSPTVDVVGTNPLVAFLEKVQEAALRAFGSDRFDPKTYVDMSLKQNLSVTQTAFNKLRKVGNGSIPKAELEKFILYHLVGPGRDLVIAHPVDFVDKPEGFLPKVHNPEVRNWAMEIHKIWRNLSRKVADEVKERPDLHTLLPLKNPVIIPGSRFKEVYYWDSYWVIRGLLVSKMYETATGIVYNLLSLLDQFGFVLNGARAYYTNRRQPPLLSSMVVDIYNHTSDISLVNKSLPLLLREHKFWNSGMHKVSIQDPQGVIHTLSRYYAKWNEPRPESSTIDKETASKLSDKNEKNHLYREIATTAESGWDFTSRFMRNGSDLTTLATTSILPVDLNAFILKMELDIGFLAGVLGKKDLVEFFYKASNARKDSINSIFWNEEVGQWCDYWLNNNNIISEGVDKWDSLNQNKGPFASNFIPLWIDLFNKDHNTVKKVIKSFRASGLLCPAGIATTLYKTGQQWDFPNGWAPLQHMIVEGLLKSGTHDGESLAKDIATRWLRTNYAVYNKTGAMYEKYDVEKCGEYGGGGEYVSQTGFGWSNGVVLAFLEEFGWPADCKMDCQE
ncbi:unnamed protein product [Cuscuta epithymum]|uniref:Trehalase n=1 Tax=Cuscuta epithymum TaxID=186058 RepID=A0AAV0EL05_9ASTE|nr:unnamed protein product [Cuscuta epithymum]